MALPEVPHRHMDLLAEIYRRRYDQFSHILRVYRVEAAEIEPLQTSALGDKSFR
jgi:hypothetical protein